MAKAKQVKKVKVTVMLEAGGWEALRIEAIKEKKAAGEIIDQLISGYLKRKGIK